MLEFDMSGDLDEVANFQNEPLSRELCDYSADGVEIFTISAMSDEEVRQSVIQDILAATMIQKEQGVSLEYDFANMIRFVNAGNHERVVTALNDEEVQSFIIQENGQYRIADDPTVLQAAMDFCGVYYEGFDWPDGVITVNREGFQEKVIGLLDHMVGEMPDAGHRINAPYTHTVH